MGKFLGYAIFLSVFCCHINHAKTVLGSRLEKCYEQLVGQSDARSIYVSLNKSIKLWCLHGGMLRERERLTFIENTLKRGMIFPLSSDGLTTITNAVADFDCKFKDCFLCADHVISKHLILGFVRNWIYDWLLKRLSLYDRTTFNYAFVLWQEDPSYVKKQVKHMPGEGDYLYDVSLSHPKDAQGNLHVDFAVIEGNPYALLSSDEEVEAALTQATVINNTDETSNSIDVDDKYDDFVIPVYNRFAVLAVDDEDEGPID